MVRVSDVDSDNYLGRLTDNDKSRFKSQYRDNRENIDDEDILDLLESEYRSNILPTQNVFEAIKNAFHSDNPDGFRTEYELSFTNPLFEIEENPADILLTESNHRSVNLCFVVCEPSGEDYVSWPNRIGEVNDIVVGHKGHILDQLGVDGKDINHIQYVTAVRKRDCRDIEFEYLRKAGPTGQGTGYALWSVDDDFAGEDSKTQSDGGSSSDPPVQLTVEGGNIIHSKLQGPVEDGINYLQTKYKEVSIALSSPEIVGLQETLMNLITQQYGSSDHPREFDRSDFQEQYVDLCEVGPSGDKKQTLLKDKANDLLELAKDSDVLYHGDHNRINGSNDFRVRYQGSVTEGLKSTVKSKVLKSKIPHKKAEMAYENTRNTFTPKDSVQAKAEDIDGSK